MNNLNRETIAILRHRLGLTQEDFARELGVHRSTIAKIEAGFTPVSSRLKTKIFQTFQVDDSFVAMLKQMKTFDQDLKEEF